MSRLEHLVNAAIVNLYRYIVLNLCYDLLRYPVAGSSTYAHVVICTLPLGVLNALDSFVFRMPSKCGAPSEDVHRRTDKGRKRSAAKTAAQVRGTS